MKPIRADIRSERERERRSEKERKGERHRTTRRRIPDDPPVLARSVLARDDARTRGRTHAVLARSLVLCGCMRREHSHTRLGAEKPSRKYDSADDTLADSADEGIRYRRTGRRSLKFFPKPIRRGNSPRVARRDREREAGCRAFSGSPRDHNVICDLLDEVSNLFFFFRRRTELSSPRAAPSEWPYGGGVPLLAEGSKLSRGARRP